MVSPGQHQHRYATAVEHAVGYYFAGSKCEPNLCQKFYYSYRPKYFFFASTAESRSTFFKLVLDTVSKFGWMKN